MKVYFFETELDRFKKSERKILELLSAKSSTINKFRKEIHALGSLAASPSNFSQSSGA